MLETILRLYRTAMAQDVRSPTPHLFGPPGCGKSTVVEQAAQLLGVQLHTINVSRISPLELEGVQMPVDSNTRLELLTARYWTQLKEGDILLFDEFLRGFPEVYNGLLDIFTARRVGGFELPQVFVIAASNSTVTYDPALEDRLLHLPVADPRHSTPEKKRLGQLLNTALGLHPDMANSPEMTRLIQDVVCPTFNILDSIRHGGTKVTTGSTGYSIRNLIGQAKLRYVTCSQLEELITMNNQHSLLAHAPQHVLLLPGAHQPPSMQKKLEALVGNPKLTPQQQITLHLNLQLIELAAIQKEVEEVSEPDPF